LIEIMLDPEVITTRGTLSAITQNALKNKWVVESAWKKPV
jgi:hypothetical protein